jgi:hypothetical protein
MAPFQDAELSRYDGAPWAWEVCVRRREFVTLIGIDAACGFRAAYAQQTGKIPTVAFLPGDASGAAP